MQAVPIPMGFTLRELTLRYLIVLCPKVEISEDDPRTGKKRKIKVPITIRYERILNLEKLYPPSKWAAYKEELFGTGTDVFSPEHFNELEIISRLKGVDYQKWEEEYSIDLQARLIAKVQLTTLVDLVRRHDQLQKDKQKKMEQELLAKQKQKTAKRSPRRGSSRGRSRRRS